MSRESLFNIPQIDPVAEKAPTITPGRIARGISVRLIKRFATEGMIRRGLFPTERAKSILEGLKSQAAPESPEWKIFFDHLLPIKNRLLLLANARIHPDMRMRDCHYAFEFIQDPYFQDNILRQFEERQRPNGQIPTAIAVLGETAWHLADDESTLLYIISAASLIREDKDTFLTPQREAAIRQALGFVKKHTFDGMYVTPEGERRNWIDAFIFPLSDVDSQNQGLYAVALQALDNSMGYPIHPKGEIQAAKEAFSKLARRSGYLPFSARFSTAIGPGSLYPEYLSITRYGETMLSDSVVSNTLKALVRSRHGIKVLTSSPDGDYFDPSYFVTGYKQGDYQNGGVWPLWENIALVVGELHGVVDGGDLNYRQRIINQLGQTNWPEYIRTGGEYEERLTPQRPWHVWNIAVPAQHRIVDRVLAAKSGIPIPGMG